MSTLSIWTVYADPSDYPGLFVARRFELDRPTGDVLTVPTLHALRALLRERLPPHLLCLPQSPDDEPQVVESWL